MVAIHGYDTDGTSGSESGGDENSRNNRNNSERPPSSSWRGWKERGKQAYLKGDYASALQNYSQALQRQNNILNNSVSNHQVGNRSNSNSNNNNLLPPSRLDRQVLLSNMVACRLKLGGAPQAEAAVANAQKCISIDNAWAKGHMRLAEAYIALGRSITTCSTDQDIGQKRMDCSNKACDALQRVIDLDPTNQNARNMLTKELRYWAVHGNNNNTSSGANSVSPEPSAPPEYMDDNRNQNETFPNREYASTNDTSTSEQQQQQQQQASNSTDGIDIEDDNNYVFTPSWQDRLVFQVQKARAWYAGLREDDKTLVKLAILFVVLYVAFGGRFGLEYLGKKSSSPRRSSSAYDDFYQSRNSNHRRYDTNYDRYGGSTSNWRSASSSYSTTNSSSGGYYGHYSYVLLVLGASYIGQRFFGVGPYQALFFVNMLLGRRNRGFMPRRRYGWGNGLHFGARPHYHHRPGGMWGF